MLRESAAPAEGSSLCRLWQGTVVEKRETMVSEFVRELRALRTGTQKVFVGASGANSSVVGRHYFFVGFSGVLGRVREGECYFSICSKCVALFNVLMKTNYLI